MVNIGRGQTLDPGRNQGKGALWEQFGRWEDRQVCQRSAGVWETVTHAVSLYCRPIQIPSFDSRVIRQITHLATDNILPVCDGASNEGLGLCLSCARVSAV